MLRDPFRLHGAARAALLLLALAGATPAQQAPPTAVGVDEVQLQTVQQRSRVSGEVRARRRAAVAVREPGLLLELLVREGDRVEKGQELAHLDPALLEADVAILAAQEAEAAAARIEREAAVEQARRDLAALEELARHDAAQPKEVADARTTVDLTAARLAQAERQLDVLAARRALLERRQADMTPRAPFAGVVARRRSTEGEWVETGGALVDLISADDLEAWLDVPQAHYAALASATGSLWVDVDAAGRLEVDRWRIVPSLSSQGRTFPLVVDLPAGSGLAAGMSLVAEVPTASSAEHLTVARDGILLGETGSYVYVAQPGPDGGPPVAAIAPVEVLFYTADRAAVRSPRLEPGAQVVVEGNERLYPTAALAPHPVAEAQGR